MAPPSHPAEGALVVLVPVLRRPHRVRPLLDSVEATTSGARVLFISDPDDQEEIDALEAEGAEYLPIDGNYATKINAGTAATHEPLLFFGADDLDFHPGWLEAAVAALKPGIGVVGTQDLCNARVLRGEHATHFLVTREYAEEPLVDGGPGPLFEGYLHEYVDDEFVGTAKKRDAFAFAPDSVVEHLHPDAGKAPMDDLYSAQARRMRKSRPLFLERRPLWT